MLVSGRIIVTGLLFVLLAADMGCIAAARRVGRELGRKSAEKKSAERALSVDPVQWTARPGHPRLMADDKAWAAAKSDDAFRRAWTEKLRDRADEWIEGGELVEYDSKRLLTRSREALQRLPTYAGLWRITGEKKYADAGRRELLNVCSFEDWTPSNFLALSEMSNAVGVGYDWLFDALSKEDRRTVVEAIVEKGLKPSLDAYASGGGWTTAPHNWNLVCNGGMIVASMAVLEEEPATARRILGLAMKSIESGLATYDECRGGWPEGPMYHNYATRYAVFAAAAIETGATEPYALPSPFLRDAGRFRIQLEGPTGKSFNFGDSDEVVGNSAWLMWMGARYDPRYTVFQVADAAAEPTMFDLLWYVSPAKENRLPLSDKFPVCDVVSMRSGWSRNATYLAIKGGSTTPNHTHLDLGTFVIDMLGERFAGELGADNYDMPGYLGPKRADYLRSSTEGQNAITIGGDSQPLTAKASIDSYDGDTKTVTIDLSDAYPAAKSVRRTASLTGDVVAIRDEIRLGRAANVVWHLHTAAQAEVVGQSVFLTQNGKRVEMKINQPAGAVVELAPDATEPPAVPVKGMTHVRVSVENARSIDFDIEFRAAPKD